MKACVSKVLLTLCMCCVFVVGRNAKFKSLSCVMLRAEWADVKECAIKAINRTQNVINLRIILKQTVRKCQVSFKLLKRERGGWHPFLYAMTVDICDFFRRPNKYVVPKLMYEYIEPYTNINSTCPFKANSDLSLSGWHLNESSIISRFPIDYGEYGLHTIWYVNKEAVAQVNGSVIYAPY